MNTHYNLNKNTVFHIELQELVKWTICRYQEVHVINAPVEMANRFVLIFFADSKIVARLGLIILIRCQAQRQW